VEFDLVINDGAVIDGTGRPRFKAHVGVTDGKIAAISESERLSGKVAIEAEGMAVAPGFIDVHSHSDWILPLADHDRILAPLLLQGITTVVSGQCGFSPAPVLGDNDQTLDGISDMLREAPFAYRWRSFAEFLGCMQSGGLLFNAAFLVGHGTLRSQVMGNDNRAPGQEELEAMIRAVRDSIHQGAFGLSAGLAYAPGVFARNDELLSLVGQAAQAGGIFTVHGRAYTWVSPFYKPMFIGPPHNLRSVRELIALAKQAGVRLQLSHQIFVGRRTWRTYRSVLSEIEAAVTDGLDVAFDAFPYPVGNSTIKVVFPDWFLDGFERNIDDRSSLRRLNFEMSLLQKSLGIRYADIRLMWAAHPELKDFEGLEFEDIARRLKMSNFEAYLHVARLSGGQANVLLGTYSADWENEEPLRVILAHPLCSFMTDTILTSRGLQNPASYGAFPRVLGRYSRDLGLFTLEEAVRRMTSYPAERTGLQDVGRIQDGYHADLVIFDPGTIAENITPDQSQASPSGIRAVIVSGQIAAEDGKIIPGLRAGRVLRR
jgi:N-acyl-D-amino-acid deacylase